MVWVLLAVAALLGAGAAYEQIGRAWDRRRYPPLGRLIRAGGLLHVLESGSPEAPTVVLEAGLAGSLMGWGLVQPPISEFAHVISYDRAGLGWSEPPQTSRTVDHMTAELLVLLHRLRARPPFYFVGHSFGGLLARAFAHIYPDDVSGLLLIDPVGIASWANCSPEEQRRLQHGVRLSRRGARLASFGVVRAALSMAAAGNRWFPNLMSKTAGGQGSSLIERMLGEVRLLPREHTPRIRSHWSSPKCFRAMADYLECLPGSARCVVDWQLRPEIAVTVLSAANATESELAERDAWVAQSLHGKHIRVPGSGHWVQIRRPEVVVEAVRDLIREIRRHPADDLERA